MELEAKPEKQILAERLETRNRYPKTVFPDPVMEPLWWGRRNIEPVPDRNAIVNKTDGTVFAVCSDRYKVVHYEDVVNMVEGVISTLDGYGKIEICPYILSDGGKMKLTLKFPEAKHKIAVGDSIFPKIEVFSSYDLSYKLMGKFGAFQLKCSNGMGVWKMFKSFARKHLQNLNLKDLQHTISEGLELFGAQVIDWKKWAETKLDAVTYNALWEQLPFSPTERKKIEVLPEIGSGLIIEAALKDNNLTVWQLNSVLTQFATHEVASEIRRIELEPDIAHALELAYNSVTN